MLARVASRHWRTRMELRLTSRFASARARSTVVATDVDTLREPLADIGDATSLEKRGRSCWERARKRQHARSRGLRMPLMLMLLRREQE